MKVLLGIPSYSWGIKLGTMRSLIGDLFTLDKEGCHVVIFDEAGNTEIGAAREVIFKKFLSSDCTDLVFIDDDVVWEAGGLVKLLSHDVPLVGGAYPKRVEPLEWPVVWDSFNSSLEVKDGLIKVCSLPAGFLRIRRDCALKMNDKYGSTVFDNIRTDLAKFSEDISFCKRWTDIDGDVWLDPEIGMAHIGNKVFHGHIGNWLRERE